MDITVSEDCLGCGQCSTYCPDVFRNESGVSQAVSSAVSDDVKFDIVLAMEDCPAGAIKFSYQ